MPAAWTFAGLAAGLAVGLILQGTDALEAVVAVTGPVGTLWLKALQMTILPLVSSLIFIGVLRAVAAASAGAMARRTLGLFVAVLLASGLLSVLLTPLLLALFPVPARAVAALSDAAPAQAVAVPGLGDFLASLIPANVFEAATHETVLPVILFMVLFALATARLPQQRRDLLGNVFEAIAGAMMGIIGWVLRLAPLGVFALALGTAAKSGAALIAVLAHYIAIVAAAGFVVLLAAYVLAMLAGRIAPLPFARSLLPAQAVAISTQSSLASLPAMLAACRTLGLREASAEVVLPLAVALFRATSPAMNLAVVIYVAHLTGTPLAPQALGAGLAVSMLAMLGSPSLPGTISFVTSTGPIALAMGVPIGPLALLVAVEMLPDIMRTVGNVTMDVAVTTAVDRGN
ncbi:MAG: dicarboxylate/amino acid:cation symporter [Novosphingobium sp.]